jgi:hypothetical protein
MAQFTQPQNQERDLQAIMEGYEGKIGHKYWLAEAFQKDAIQNSWDARIDKKRGKNWSFKFFYLSNPKDLPSILGFIDTGTYGLTGIIPKNANEAISALNRKNKKEREKERLAYFLSSNWSNKPRDAIGSRGRGKMIFIGASKNKIIYFESIRLNDKQYVFGRIFLDKDKAIKVEIDSGKIANKKREEIFKNIVPPLLNSGTRILFFNPRKELIEAITNGEMVQLIQHTWWEILYKYNAKIEIEIDGKNQTISSSPFLPVEKFGVSTIFNSGLITLKENSNLRIKNISLCYLGDKDIPEYYKGLSIQVYGMSVERLKIENLIFESIGNKIYGAVTFDKELEEKIARDCEGPEHCDIIWTRTPANNVRNVLKSEIRKFAERYKLIDEQRTQVSKKQRAVEITTQNDLNQLAKNLNLLGIAGKRRTRTGKERSVIEKLRLSIADFKTPYENGRTDRGQSVEGTYVVPINEYSNSLLVLVKVRIFRHKDGKVIKSDEKELRIPEEQIKVGWPEIKIDTSFERGGYTFRAEMYSLEDRKISKEISYEKGELVYHPVSRTFYVEEDPPEKGFFKIENRAFQDKRKFIWIEEGDKQYILCYNGLHPIIDSIMKGKEYDKLLRDLLFREGSYFAYGIRLAEDKALIEEGEKPLIFTKEEIKSNDFQSLLNQVVFRRSSYLWDFYKLKG